MCARTPPIWRIGLAILGTLALGVLMAMPDAADARASRASRQNSRLFRELIVSGERPEIVACVVAAVAHAPADREFDAVRWGSDVSDTAYMRETEGGIHLTRTVRFKAEARSRAHPLFSTWQNVEVVCEQRDEQSPEVVIKPVSP